VKKTSFVSDPMDVLADAIRSPRHVSSGGLADSTAVPYSPRSAGRDVPDEVAKEIVPYISESAR
jgi:hypothetical protein